MQKVRYFVIEIRYHYYVCLKREKPYIKLMTLRIVARSTGFERYNHKPFNCITILYILYKPTNDFKLLILNSHNLYEYCTHTSTPILANCIEENAIHPNNKQELQHTRRTWQTTRSSQQHWLRDQWQQQRMQLLRVQSLLSSPPPATSSTSSELSHSLTLSFLKICAKSLYSFKASVLECMYPRLYCACGAPRVH